LATDHYSKVTSDLLVARKPEAKIWVDAEI